MFKLKNLLLASALVLLVIALPTFLSERSKKADTYFVPSYIPAGYEKINLENDVVFTESTGIGFAVAYANGNKTIRITTYKKTVEFKESCQKGDRGNFTKVKLYDFDGMEACTYTYQDETQQNKHYYLVKDDHMVRIYQEGEPYLPEEEIEKMISSFQKIHR